MEMILSGMVKDVVSLIPAAPGTFLHGSLDIENYRVLHASLALN